MGRVRRSWLPLLVASWVGLSPAQTRYVPPPEPQSPNGLFEGGAIYRYPVPGPLRISPRRLGLCFARSLTETAPGYHLSVSGMKERRRTGCDEYRNLSPAASEGALFPFQDYLKAEMTRCYDFHSGHEEELAEWILDPARPDDSVDPVALFEQALELTGGNVWTAVLTVHDLLRNRARWFDRVRYSYRSSREEQERLFNKLIDLRGDLRELGGPNTGDHFGSWYRLWLGMLLRLMFGEEAPGDWVAERSPVIDFRDGVTTGIAVSAAMFWMGAELGESRDHDKKRKTEMTVAGIHAADWMVRGLRDPGLAAKHGITREACDSRIYLRPVR